MRIETRYFLRFIVATVLGVCAVVAWRWLPRPLPPEECSELYRAYMDTPGVDATFIRGFQVNDTVSVDVTLLQTTDSAGWATLLGNVRLPEETQEDIELLKQKKSVCIRRFPKGRLDLPSDSDFKNNDLLAIDWAKQTLAIFHIKNIEQQLAIISYHLDIVKNNKTQQK